MVDFSHRTAPPPIVPSPKPTIKRADKPKDDLGKIKAQVAIITRKYMGSKSRWKLHPDNAEADYLLCKDLLTWSEGH